MLTNLKSKAVELDGKIEAAQMRHEASRQALATAHLTDGDIPRAQADETAARVDLDALRQAHAALLENITLVEKEALEDLLAKRTNKVQRLTKTYFAKLQKVEDFIGMALTELAASNNALDEIREAASLPAIGDQPPAWEKLNHALRDPHPPVAIAIASLIAREDRVFAEHLGRALSNHKTASVQCAGRSVTEMALNPYEVIAA